MPLSGPTAHPPVMRLTLACNLAEVRRAALTLCQFLAGQGCTQKEVLDSELALVEACNNAILHADEAGRLHPVMVEASCNPLEIELRITDNTSGARQRTPWCFEKGAPSCKRGGFGELIQVEGRARFSL